MTAHLLTQWCRLIVDRLAVHGVRHVVSSPGSRNTAAVIAAVQHADLTLHDSPDERAGAFLALGLTRATGAPTALICTSGTAGAHYYPAVIEASALGLPLVVITADRPFELMECGAPQAMDQTRLFGIHARWFADLGMPDPTPRALRAVARKAEQAVWRSQHPDPGPVHLDLRIRKPFEPEPAVSPAEHAVEATVDALLKRPTQLAAPHERPPPPLDALRDALMACRRGVVLAGPTARPDAPWADAALQLCRQTGFPLLAESASQLRHLDAAEDVRILRFDLLLKSSAFREHMRPDAVVQIGAPVMAGSVAPWLEGHDHLHVVVAERGWNDWVGAATHLVFGDPGPTLAALTPPARADRAWLDAWRTADTHLDRHIGADSDGTMVAVRSLLDGLPPDATLHVANSLSIRLVDWFTRPGRVPVYSQRGVNGIDGAIAAAVGAVRATQRPAILLLGDITALHDLTSLHLAQSLPAPLVIVLLDNGGGRIFDILPVATHPGVPPGTLTHLRTPVTIDWGHAARGLGVPCDSVAPAELSRAIATAAAGTGCRMLHVSVPETQIRDRLTALVGKVDIEQGRLP